MKVARCSVIAILMSSFLVLGFDTDDASTPQPAHLMHVTTAAASADIWTDDPGVGDVTPDSASGLVAGGDVTGADRAPSERSPSENVILNKDVAAATITSTAASTTTTATASTATTTTTTTTTRTPSGRSTWPARSSVSQSVINTNDRKPATATGAPRDADAQPSRLSQLSASERAQLLNNLEASFLRIIGLSSRPRPAADVAIPQYMRELYERHARPRGPRTTPSPQGGALHNSNTIRSFFHTENEDKHPENVVRLKFNITSFPGHEVLQAAELRLYREAVEAGHHLRPTSSSSSNETLADLLGQRHRIDVYQIMASRGRHPAGTMRRLIDTRIVNPTQSGWETFDVTPALEAWRRTDDNHGLEVRFAKLTGEPTPLRHVRLRRSASALRRHGRSKKRAGDGDAVADANWDVRKPLLVTYSQDPAGRRQPNERRNKRNTDRKRGRRKRSKKNRGKRRKDRPRKDRDYKRDCRRRALYVDFHDVGWTDWIVAPPGYDAFYCYGECPFHMSDHFNTTNHAVVQQFVHSVDPQAVPKPCCVPTELGQLALLYIDEQGKVVLKNYDEMVVEACGCR